MRNLIPNEKSTYTLVNHSSIIHHYWLLPITILAMVSLRNGTWVSSRR